MVAPVRDAWFVDLILASSIYNSGRREELPKEAPWLADFEAELLAFPSGRYDDQVDALLLFLDWFPRAQRYDPPVATALPIFYSSRSYDDFGL